MTKKPFFILILTLLLIVTVPATAFAGTQGNSSDFCSCRDTYSKIHSQCFQEIFDSVLKKAETAKADNSCGSFAAALEKLLHYGFWNTLPDNGGSGQGSDPDETISPDDGNNGQDSDGTPPSTDAGAYQYAQDILALVNAERSANGLKSLTLKDSLCAAAYTKSKDMADYNYFSHTSPNFGSSFDLLNSRGIVYSYAGENIAKGYTSPEAVMKGWMNSSGHRANILNSNFTQLGVGYYKAADGQTYWTQIFIRP